ncbi:MAG: sigma-70 family RNA polymerase sigma factor [Clostridia bacterium]|nr:sigma-70 family RNA polymerase sigma factor [Clostridia bacterium]
MDDKNIVSLYVARDQNAIAESDKKYGAFCHSISMNIVNNRQDAEECVNDTWLGAWNSIPPHLPASLRTYLAKLTRRISINKWKASRRAKRNPDLIIAFSELEDCIPAPEDTDEVVLCELIDRFLSTEDTTDRLLFIGRYWYNRAVGDMAAYYGLTTNAVSGRLKRMRQRLHKFLEKEGYGL